MGSKYRGNEEELRALNAYIKLVRSCESVTARINRILVERRLTASQFDVLEALLHLGPLCQRDLARKIRKSTANITLVIDALEGRCLVTRQRSSEDRRFFAINLTAEGEQLIREVFAGYLQAIMAELAALDQEEQQQLDRLCRKLGLKEGGESR